MSRPSTTQRHEKLGDVTWRDVAKAIRLPHVKFSLARLLIAFTLIGLILAYPAWILRATSRDRAIEREIASWNASIVHDYLGPRWLRGILGNERCRVIHSIQFYGGPVPEHLERLKELRSLGYLSISDCELLDSDVEKLGVLPSLHSLSLNDTCITARSLQTIRHYPKLTDLSVWHTPIDAQDLKLLRGAPTLKSIRGIFTQQELDAAKADPVSFPWELNALKNPPSYPPLTPEPKRTPPDVAFEQLQSEIARRIAPPRPGEHFALSLSGPYHNDGHLAALEHYPGITQLYLTWNETSSITGAGLQFLQNQQALRVVHLSGRIHAEHLAALSRCSSIAELTIKGSADEIGSDGFAHLGKLPRLKKLELHCFRLKDEHLLALKDCVGLEHFDIELSGKLCTSEGLAVIQHFPALMYLDISGTKASNRLLPHLLSRTKLQELRINRTFLDGPGQAQLANLKKLTHLWVGGFPYQADPATVQAIQGKLPACEIHAF